MGNSPTKTRKIKKYLLQKRYYKLTDDQLGIAVKLLKPEQIISTFLYQQNDTSVDDEYLIHRFIGIDSNYLAQYTVFPITAMKIKQLLVDVQVEEVKRKMIREHYQEYKEEQLEQVRTS